MALVCSSWFNGNKVFFGLVFLLFVCLGFFIPKNNLSMYAYLCMSGWVVCRCIIRLVAWWQSNVAFSCCSWPSRVDLRQLQVVFWQLRGDFWQPSLDFWHTTLDFWQSFLDFWLSSLDFWQSSLEFWQSSLDLCKSGPDFQQFSHDFWNSSFDSTAAALLNPFWVTAHFCIEKIHNCNQNY